MNRYLSAVVILGLAYFNWHQYQDMKDILKANDDQKMRAIEYWREAYKKSNETYLLMIQKYQDEESQKRR